MTAPDLTPEFLALPVGPNGLPDLLVLSYTYYQGHLQTTVDAFVVSSDRNSQGYWGERIFTTGDMSKQWSRLYAIERAREHVVSLLSAEQDWQRTPLEFLPFKNWEVLAVQRELGFYPMLQTVANACPPVAVALRDKPVAYEFNMNPRHYPPKAPT